MGNGMSEFGGSGGSDSSSETKNTRGSGRRLKSQKTGKGEETVKGRNEATERKEVQTVL